MNEYTTEDVLHEVLWSKIDEAKPKHRRAFDRWLAEVERSAAEKAWDRCVGEMPLGTDWKNYYVDNNPYRQERKEQ